VIARKAATLRQRMHEEREQHGCDWQPPPGLVRASYRKATAGAHHDGVWLAKDETADLAAELANLVGPLANGPEIAPSGSTVVREPLSTLTEHQSPGALPMRIWAVAAERAQIRERVPDG
jgi:hypothetical protein